MKFCIYGVFSLLIGIGSAFSQEVIAEKGTIIVTIKNIKNNKGQIRASLFKNEDGFPDKPEKACKILKMKILDNDSMVVEFKGLDYQEYAVAILHDEDGDNDMKTGMFGIPKEGYGVSKDAKGTFGPPDFEDAKINLNSKKIFIKIKMTY